MIMKQHTLAAAFILIFATCTLTFAEKQTPPAPAKTGQEKQYGSVDKKLEQLNQMRVKIEKLLAEKEAKESKKIQDLAKMYEKMAADKAAMLLSTIDQELAISILAKMKTKSAAKILNNIEREKAAKLSTAFSLDN